MFLITSNVIVMGLVLWMLVSSRHPLCIDSRLVEKIDITYQHGSESAWSCRLRKKVPFSPYLNEMLPQINHRVQEIESLFQVLGPLKKPVRIHISLQNPWIFEVVDHSLLIGEKLFRSKGHLEKAFYKVWYRERSSSTFSYADLREESITDLMVYLSQQELNIEDRAKGFKTKITGAHWPQVLKSPVAYCDSPWKISEHYHICLNEKQPERYIKAEILPSSLRALVSSALIESYQKLDFKSQNVVLQNLAKFVASERTPRIETSTQKSDFLLGREIIIGVQDYLQKAASIEPLPSYKVLNTHFTQSLRRRGFSEASSEIYFDFIYESQAAFGPQSETFQNLKSFAKKNPQKQIAAIAKDKIWFFPAGDPMDLKLFKKIKSFQRVSEKCGDLNFSYVYSFFEKADKLIILNSCEKAPKNISSLIGSDPEQFALENKNIAFVQFHLPSLELKRDQIPTTESLMALMQSKDMNNPILKVLGWQEVHLESESQTYRPKAQVEAIQWFRPPPSEKL